MREGLQRRSAKTASGKDLFSVFSAANGGQISVGWRRIQTPALGTLALLSLPKPSIANKGTSLTKIVQDFTFRGERRQDIPESCDENPANGKQRLNASDHFNCLDASLLLLLCTLPRHLQFLRVCLFWLSAQFLRKPRCRFPCAQRQSRLSAQDPEQRPKTNHANAEKLYSMRQSGVKHDSNASVRTWGDRFISKMNTRYQSPGDGELASFHPLSLDGGQKLPHLQIAT